MKKLESTTIAFILVITTVVSIFISFIYFEVLGADKITEDKKIETIKKCTENNLGLKYKYYMDGRTKNIECCGPGELYCTFENLKEPVDVNIK